MLTKLIKYYFEIDRWQKMPVGRVKELQLVRFKQLFDYAKKHSPFYQKIYKDAGVYDLDIRNYEDIQKLPVIDKYLMKKYNIEEILTQPLTEKLNMHTTSGSTGEPFRIYQTKYEDYTAHVRVFHLLRSIGYNPFRKTSMITRYEQNDQFRVENDIYLIKYLQRLMGVLYREIISVFDDPVEIIKKLEKSKPYILWSTPSVLDMISNELISKNKKLDIPYVVLTSEVIQPHQFDKFQHYISKCIVGHYGLMEATTLGYDINNSGRKKVFENSFLMEFIDEREVDGKRVGTPVVSNLKNFTMPFIRYNTHDVGTVLPIEEFPNKVIGFIHGRQDDILNFHDGYSFVHHHAHEMFMDFLECEQFKFVQKEDDTIILQLKPNRSYPIETIKAKAFERWNRRFAKYPLEIEFVEKFEINSKTGKFKNIEKIK